MNSQRERYKGRNLQGSWAQKLLSPWSWSLSSSGTWMCSPTPAIQIYTEVSSCEMLGWMKHKLGSRLPGEISITSATQWHHPYGRKWRRTKEPLDESERGEWQSWLKTQHSENEDHGIWSYHFMTNRCENNGNSERFYFGGLQNHCKWWLQPWSKKRHLLLGRKAMTHLDSILKSRDITLSTKVCLVKAMVFPVIMYGCESWTIKKAEPWKIDVFELWCWRRLLRVTWTARRSNQSILKEIRPEYPLEGLMLKLKL